MARKEISLKHNALNKANTQMVAIVAVAAFISVFSLIACKALWSQTRYQARVISAKEKAHKQLQANIKAVDSLVDQYRAFDAADPNAIGGTKSGSGDNDGSNSKIVLDALPSSYDYPAVTSSVEKMLAANGLNVSTVAGTDDQINQEGKDSSTDPKPAEVPFSFTVTEASYQKVQQLLSTFQRSIRPIKVNTMDVTASDEGLSLTVEAQTYFQPAKSLDTDKQVIR